MTERKEVGTGGRNYSKPLLMVIELKAEEVMGTGCKIEGGSIPNYNQPAGCGTGVPCSAHGS